MLLFYFFFFKQKTAYEMRISDWSSDVCSSDLGQTEQGARPGRAGVEFTLAVPGPAVGHHARVRLQHVVLQGDHARLVEKAPGGVETARLGDGAAFDADAEARRRADYLVQNDVRQQCRDVERVDRKSTRLNS